MCLNQTPSVAKLSQTERTERGQPQASLLLLIFLDMVGLG